MRGENQRRGLLCILCILCLTGAVFSTVNALRELIPGIEAEQAYGELRREAFKEGRDKAAPEITEQTADRKMPDWDVLQERNSDICGWIYGPGTAVDYPVVKGDDNRWYLEHTAEGKKNAMGAIFMECANRRSFEDEITVLYGHHIRGGRMFSSLSGYKKQDYYENHPCFYLYTPEAVYRVELFAGTVINGSTGGFPLQFAGKETRLEWIAKTLEASTFKSRTKPQDGERILALCTCSYEYQDARFAVFGVMKKLKMTTDSYGTD